MLKSISKKAIKVSRFAFYMLIINCTFAGIVTASENAHSQALSSVSLKWGAKDLTLGETLGLISEKTGFEFFYNPKKLPLHKKTHISGSENLRDMLQEIANQHKLEFRRVQKIISVKTGDQLVVEEFSAQFQEQTISGEIFDTSTREPLIGATVQVKGSTLGTITDASGKFQLKVPEEAETLVIAYIGYVTADVQINNQSYFSIGLDLNSQELQEVVVTALGIEREEKALGYSVAKLSSQEVTDATPNNWTDALKGKVAGLNLLQTGSGPINSARINLRGDRSLDPNKNEALIIVDGIPMINGKASSGVDQAYGAGSSGVDKDIPVDYGNGLADINPDDIESITVLKGAAATALYGSRAANGALLITTKKGKKHDSGIGITFNSNVSFNDVLQWPDYQYEYGQGVQNRNTEGELYYSYHLSEDGPNTGSTSSAFGPKFEGQMYYQYDPELEGQSAERQPWVPYKNNRKDFWRTGQTVTNSIALEGASDKYSARASFTHTKNEWIMPNTGFERMVAALNTGMQLSQNLRINAKMSYTNKTSDNLPGTGYNNHSIAYFMIFQNPNIDLAWYEPRWKEGQEQIAQIHPFSSYIENPYLIAHEMTNSLNSNNIEGNLQGIYTFSPKWDLMVRSGLNMRQDRREQRRPWNTAQFPQGYYKQQDVFFYESNSDVLLTYKEQLTPKLNLNISAGANSMHGQVKVNNAIARGLTLPGVFKLSNALETAVADNEMTERRISSVYGLANFSWDEKIFVDVTGRNDWSSTLPAAYNSYFYPSVSTSFVLTDIFSLPREISFAKARLSWAQVGNDTEPYRTAKYYERSDFPGSANAPTTLYNANLKPELSTSWEGGVNFYLFSRRINADLNFYTNTTVNQVLRVPMDITTGFSYAWINGGTIRNRGIEAMLSAEPVKGQNFSWNTTVTWAKNDNEILKLSSDVEGEQQVIASSGTASIIATVGGSTGDIWGYGLVRNEEGQVVFNPETGLAVRPDEITRIGDAYADWRGGFHNEFKYKNWRMTVLLDGQYGGIVYSQTHHKLVEQGKLTKTLEGRETGTITGDGVVANEDGSYSPNTTPVAINTWYADYYRRANIETNSFDASYIKLREARIEYRLPRALCSRMKLSGVSIAVFGRDLAMISDFPIYDPETASLNGATVVPGVEMGQMPTPRTWGVNLNLKL